MWCNRVSGLAVVPFLAIAPLAIGEVIHVDSSASPGGDGLTWATAYADLQDALGAAQTGDELWIAAGAYTPAPNGGDRTVAFECNTSLSIYGGFAGDETELDERDPLANVTTLSGDVDGDDGPGFANRDDNSYNVMRVTDLAPSDAVVIDGFTFTGGAAVLGSAPYWRGGGIHFDVDGPDRYVAVQGCTFTEHQSLHGGSGVHGRRGAMTLEGCNFIANHTGGGGAALSVDITVLTAIDCLFEANTSDNHGGAVTTTSVAGPTVLAACAFVDNTAGYSAGALYAYPPADLFVSSCLFENNEAVGNFEGIGGAMVVSGTLLGLVDTDFIGNIASRGGGGLFGMLDDGAPIVGCRFLGNLSNGVQGGGGAYLTGPDHVVANCIFSGNVALTEAGALSCASSHGDRVISNCSFVGNTASEVGGGVAVYDDDVISNCIFWGNADQNGTGESSQVHHFSESPPTIGYSIIQGWTGALGGVANIGDDPLFVDVDGPDDLIGTSDDDLRLMPTSPAIDSGDNDGVPADTLDLDGDANILEPIPFDIVGLPRFNDEPDVPDSGNGTAPIVDRGPHESGEAPVEALYTGAGGWFDTGNWSTGEVPDESTIVVVAGTVTIDQPGAVASTVTIVGGGSVTIANGTLTVLSLVVEDGGALALSDLAAVLETTSMLVQDGVSFAWTAGTVRIVGGSWIHPTALDIGCAGAATLVLEDAAVVTVPSILVCAQGTVTGSGLLETALMNGGLVSPGASTGSLSIDGTYAQLEDGTLVIEIAGYEPAASFDTLQVSGQATLDGLLDVVALEGFTNLVGATQTILEADFVAGSFAATTLPDLPAGIEFLERADDESFAFQTMLVATGPRLYVDATAPGGGDGQSWAGAFSTLQSATIVSGFFAGEVDEIWVAAGVYKPWQRLDEDDPLSVTFEIVDGTSLYGGFLGDEVDLDERDPALNETIISGDLAGDDEPGFVNIEDNATTLITAVGEIFTLPTAVDGFTVTAARDGAAYVNGANPSIRNCVFDTNKGGGLRYGANGIVEDCLFTGNISQGLWVPSLFTTTIVRNCDFVGNAGRGLRFEANDGRVESCTFIDNVMTGAFFSGAGAHVSSSGSVDMIDCVFIGNVSLAHGGGLEYGSTGGHLLNCIVLGNSAADGGGGLNYNDGGESVVANCVISGNVSFDDEGGGVRVANGVSGRIVNCTIAGNDSAGVHGGVATADDDVVVEIANCIVWNNSDGQNVGEAAQIGGTGTLQIGHSIVEGWTGAFGGTGNTGDDPMFVDADGADDIVGTADDDLHLQSGSPAIDSGENIALPLDVADLDEDGLVEEELPIDLDGAERRFDDDGTPDGDGTPPIVDRGPFEFGSPIDPGLYIGPEGGSWFDAGNWNGGTVPGPQTNVIITTTVVIDQSGAQAAGITILSTGALEIGTGTLTTTSLQVLAGGDLRLLDPSAQLTVTALLQIHAGGTLDWIAGTIHLLGATFDGADDLFVGCAGEATLLLSTDAVVITPALTLCPSGTLAGAGTVMSMVDSNGLVAPGASPGTLVIEGDYHQGAGGTLAIEADGYVPGLEHDVLQVTGFVTLDGTLDVTLLPAFQPLLSDVEFLTAAQIDGAFATENLPDPGAGYILALHDDGTTLSLVPVPPGPRIYVDADAPGPADGLDWETATPDLQAAFQGASLAGGAVTEIWVAQGTYIPSLITDTGDPLPERTVSFVLQNGLAVYGGFAGFESSVEDRNIAANPTIMSGDLLGDDEPDFGMRDDNAYRVVRAIDVDATTVLDGFIVMGGRSGFETRSGAGLFCSAGHPTVANCVFTDNWCDGDGTGAGCFEGSAPSFDACEFLANRGDRGVGLFGFLAGELTVHNSRFEANAPENENAGDGGGVMLLDCAPADFTNCDFVENLTGGFGAGVNLEGTDADFELCLFEGNAPFGDGGGVFGGGLCAVGGALTLDGCDFIGNAFRSGAGACVAVDELVVTGCTFTQNEATLRGAALYVGATTGTITQSTFTFNIADEDGGAIYSIDQFGTGDHPDVIGSTFTQNIAGLGGSGRGGAISIVTGALDPAGGATTITDCQFTSNTAISGGGAIRNYADLILSGVSFSSNFAPAGSAVYSRFSVLRGGNNTFAAGQELFSTDAVRPGGLAPGAETGIVQMGGNYRQVHLGPGSGSAPHLVIDIGGTTPGSGHDAIQAGDELELTGALYVEILAPFAPTLGQSFQIASAATVIDQFDVAFLPQLENGLLLDLETSANEIRLNVVPLEGSIFFGDPIDAAFLGEPTDTAVGDFDGDSDLDVAVSTSEGSVVVLRNNGVDRGGTWLGFAEEVVVTSVGANPVSITSALLDGDAFPDLVTCNAGDDTVSVLINDADGAATFTRTDVAAGSNPAAVAAGLIDGDGAIDIAVANEGDDNVLLLLNDGSGGLVSGGLVGTVAAPRLLVLAEMGNGSGDDLLVVGSPADGGFDELHVHLSTGGGQFEAALAYAVGAGASGLAAADLNNDDLADVVTTGGGGGTIAVAVNDASSPGHLAQPAETVAGTFPTSPLVLDLDEDGDRDVVYVVQEGADSIVRIARNDLGESGTIVFAEFNDLATGAQTLALAAGDVDGDGATDLIAANIGGGGTAGPATAAATVLLNEGGPTRCAGDVDNSGVVDVQDLIAVIVAWGTDDPDADVDGSGLVDVQDLVAVIVNWGPCP